ncbi:DUF6283 family protein [Pedobacter nutrimenti]|uniref:Uncharacterized protein n=1 Tax=Pedobacter nutrimenti TaxID=1241337 RepID=A0A318UK55_9SPHI|nr:DUF6283 family protein [Pedobacter nutrimenti]PYF68418.1 hypothetical protein B0O44_1122 [Pedobacter nutrimenti]
MNYKRKQPCKDCPYRKDSENQKWCKEEFENLLDKDADFIGSVFGCHKKDNHVCVGWLMDQVNRNFPSISLRFSLISNSVNRNYLNGLYCKSAMYSNINEMVKANYPELLRENMPVNKDQFSLRSSDLKQNL